MAISRLSSQDNHVQGSSGATVTVTYPVAPTQNNLLVVAISAAGQAGVQPTGPAGWAKAVGAASGFVTSIWYKIAGASEPTTAAWTLSASGSNYQAHGYEYSGCATASVVDVTNGGTATSTSPSCGATGTMANANSLVFTAYADAVADTFSAYDNSQVQLQQIAQGTLEQATAQVIPSATTTITPGCTMSASGAWLACVAVFKPYAPTDNYALASTLGALTASGTFTHPDDYTASVTLGALTLSAAYQDVPTHNLVLASTLGALSLSGTYDSQGIITHSLVLASTLGALVLSAALLDGSPGDIAGDIQTLEPGALIELFVLDATALGGGILYFHGYPRTGNIIWQGNTFTPWPVQADGFIRTSEQQPQPTVAVGNIDGSITTLCLTFDDCIGMKVLRKRTLSKYLDPANFPGNVNPTADPTQALPDEIWYVERKAHEDSVVVQFELSSALNFRSRQLPGRQVIANSCLWLTIGGYRGPFCGYTGSPVAMANDSPTSDSTLDVCGGRITSCKLRFGTNNVLPFGGYPGAGLVRS